MPANLFVGNEESLSFDSFGTLKPLKLHFSLQRCLKKAQFERPLWRTQTLHELPLLQPKEMAEKRVSLTPRQTAFCPQ